MTFTTTAGKTFSVGGSASGAVSVPKPRNDAYVFGFAGGDC